MTPQSPPEAPELFSPSLLWAAVKKNWVLVLVLSLVVVGASTFYALGQTKIYESSATILLDMSIPRPLGDQVANVDTGLSSYSWKNDEYYRTQQWMVKSPRVAARVVQELGLHKDPSFLAKAPTGRNLPPREIPVEDAAAVLTSRLTVNQIKASRLMEVTYEDADPRRAQRVLSAVVETFVQSNLDDIFESANMAADWLRTQVGSLRNDLEGSENALHQYKKDRNILSVSMDDQSNMLRGEMEQLGRTLTDVRAKRQRVLARLTELQAINMEDPESLPASELLQNGVLQDLRAKYTSAKTELSGMSAIGRGENHPLTLEVQGKVTIIRTALLREIGNIRAAQEHDLAALDREITGLQGLYREAEKRALELNLMEIEYNRLRRAKENNEKLFSLVIERSKESDLTRMLRVNNIRTVARPTLPVVPIRPKVPLSIAAGVLFGLLLGVTAAVGKEQLDRTMRTPNDVERELGLTLLGMLPTIGEGAGSTNAKRRGRRGGAKTDLESSPELFAHYRPTSGIAEAVRAIRTNIMFMSPDRPHRSLLVASAGPSEGKTTVACAVATAMAQAGQRVLLLDCDLRRPRIHRVFRCSNDRGVTTALLEGEQGLFVLETDVPNLSILPSGPLPPNPAEVLHSEAFRKLLASLVERYDRVIIDSPPVAPVTDAAVLGTLVDGALLVVRASKTTKDMARRAVKSLRDVSDSLIGVVLNAVDLNKSEYGMPQYYYYYHREGYSSDRSSREPEQPSATGTA